MESIVPVRSRVRANGKSAREREGGRRWTSAMFFVVRCDVHGTCVFSAHLKDSKVGIGGRYGKDKSSTVLENSN